LLRRSSLYVELYFKRLLRGLPMCFDIQSLLKAPRNDDRRHCEEQIQILNYFRCLLRRSSLYVELYFKRLLRGLPMCFDIQSLLKAPRNDDRCPCEEQIQILNYFRCLLRRSSLYVELYFKRLLRGLPMCFDIQSLLKAPRNDDRRHCEEQIQILNYFRCLLRRSSLYLELNFKRLLRSLPMYFDIQSLLKAPRNDG
jgi:hypothetical protein